ncbi:uncharacterized protein LOC106672058 [Cimex lectularius]|uniref:Single domain-containing protein n=1 Tax=Cimex lectularius TaxID=79782 RepID=A0A8I6S6G9_CIMLE|nr:uncharacterized protein LOC106672058 [Cimex lectularius]
MWWIWALVASYIAFSTSTTFLEFQDIENGSVPSCTDKNGTIRALGESWQLEGECVSSRCLTVSATKSLIMHYKCPSVTAQPANGCEVVQNVNLPHPNCCPELKCS